MTGLARLDDVEDEAPASQRVANGRPEPTGTATAGRGVDDEKGRRSYVRPTRPPPMTRRKSVMDGKRIIGFSRFSAPMVVCEPP